MIITPGSTSVSIDFFVAAIDGGAAVTGLVAATLPDIYVKRQGPHDIGSALSLSDLLAVNAAWSAGGVYEKGLGWYRLDLADSYFASAGPVYDVVGNDGTNEVLCHVLEVKYPAVNVTQWKGTTAPAMSGDAYGLLAGVAPAEAAGRPTTLAGMIRRVFEWASNKRTRDRSTGTVLLRNAADDGTLETQTQSTSGTVDTQTKGA